MPVSHAKVYIPDCISHGKTKGPLPSPFLPHGKSSMIPMREKIYFKKHMKKNINLNGMSWRQLLALCLQKFAYEKAINSYNELPGLRRLVARRPKDPALGVSSDSLAVAYVRAFKEVHRFNGEPFGVRQVVGDHLYREDTVHITLRYQVEDRLPVLTATYYEDGTAYVESRKFLPGGATEVNPAHGPIAEIALMGIPDRADVREVGLLKETFDETSGELRWTMASVC